MRWIDRRAFLKLGAAGLTTHALVQPAEAGIFLFKRMFAVPPRETRAITPNEDFYIVNYAGYPNVQIHNWTLFVGGMVKRPTRFNLYELLAKPSVEQMVTLICIDTLPGADTIGNAVWTGIRLGDLLAELEPDPSAHDLLITAADGYTESIPFARAMEPDVLLAYKMNGEFLPPAHGYPFRIIVPGLYGIKNVKWVTSIEVVDYDYKGYWQQRGWTDKGEIQTISRIDSPGHYQDVPRSDVEVRGIAFAGPAGITRVELSLNGGKRWEEATLDPSLSPFSWILWRFRWRPQSSGAHTLVVRAWNGRGQVQAETIARAYPAGATGYHTIIPVVG